MIPKRYIDEAEKLDKHVYVIDGHMAGQAKKIQSYPVVSKTAEKAKLKAKREISSKLVIEKITRVW